MMHAVNPPEGHREPDFHRIIHRFGRRFIEPVQDLIVIAMAFVLFALMVRVLLRLAEEVVAAEMEFSSVIAEVLFILVMVELVRLLLAYLTEHRVAIDTMVELGIVSTLREVMLRGAAEINWVQVLALAVLLLTLGLLLRFGDLRTPAQPVSLPPLMPQAHSDHCETTSAPAFSAR